MLATAPQVSDAAADEILETAHVPLQLVIPSPDNVRLDYGDMEEFSLDIAANGVEDPVLVAPLGRVILAPPYPRPDEIEWELIAGHRRRLGAEMAGRHIIPARLAWAMSPEERERRRGKENLSRKDLTPVEEGMVYEQRAQRGLADRGARYTTREVAAFYNKSQAQVAKRMALLLLPEDVRQLIPGRISATEGYALSQLATHPDRLTEIALAHVAETLGKSIGAAVAEAKLELDGAPSGKRQGGRRAAAPESDAEDGWMRVRRTRPAIWKIPFRDRTTMHRRVPVSGSLLDALHKSGKVGRYQSTAWFGEIIEEAIKAKLEEHDG